MKTTIHIRPQKGLQLIDVRELRQYRDLLYFLVARDIKVKYKQTVLGGLWAVIQPFCMMVVFTLFFGRLARIPSDGVPYPIFNYTALIAWTYFAQAVSQSGNSIVGSGNLITKVYFPRLIIPLTPVIAGLLDFAIAFAVLVGMMAYFRIYPTAMAVTLPLLTLLMMLTAGGAGMLLAALNAKYRDIRYTIPFLMQFWMFATPIVYPASLVPERYRMIYALNPMTGVIEGFRAALLGTVPFPTDMVLLSLGVSLAMFLTGLTYFKQVERHFADVI
ncbi:MAG TPA: ABC transporter permease [Deltaproteobacteria bacterium]|nr:ABC transporter permease [Deltaproteobacteria bacterium]